jgi:hypothetical protein
MKFYMRCLYVLLILILIVVVSLVYEQDKQEEVKYHQGLPIANKKGCKMLEIKARDGALSGLIMGTLSSGPIGGLAMAAKYGIVNPIVGGLSHLRKTDDRIICD